MARGEGMEGGEAREEEGRRREKRERGPFLPTEEIAGRAAGCTKGGRAAKKKR